MSSLTRISEASTMKAVSRRTGRQRSGKRHSRRVAPPWRSLRTKVAVGVSRTRRRCPQWRGTANGSRHSPEHRVRTRAFGAGSRVPSLWAVRGDGQKPRPRTLGAVVRLGQPWTRLCCALVTAHYRQLEAIVDMLRQRDPKCTASGGRSVGRSDAAAGASVSARDGR